MWNFGNFLYMGREIVLRGVKASENEQKFISETPDISSFYTKYTVFSSDCTKLRSFGLLRDYAQKIAHFALVTIDFLLDTRRFLRPYLITGL